MALSSSFVFFVKFCGRSYLVFFWCVYRVFVFFGQPALLREFSFPFGVVVLFFLGGGAFCTEFYRVLPSFTEVYLVLSRCTKF